MKKTLFLLAAVTLIAAAPSHGSAGAGEAGKDRCLLLSENCPEFGDSITERIAKLQKEISKGEKVYSPGEVVRLETKLEEYQTLLDNLLAGGGGD